MDVANSEPAIMPLDLLREITDDFSEERKIGHGSFGAVYLGVHPNGEKIAVKKLYNMPGLDDEQFQNEFRNLSRLRHKNIVRLVGYCHDIQEVQVMYEGKLVIAEKIHKALCLEYMSNGSLDKYLSDECNRYDWQKGYRMIKGICQGLKYLHNELKQPIYHLDLKPANVLLDENMVPRIADFGMSRLFGDEQTRATKSSLGTIGYLPPEYITKNLVSNKFDIFSLGVVIIKIMAGRAGYFNSADMSSEEFTNLVQDDWTTRLLETSNRRNAYSEQVKICIEIGLSCVQEDRHKRPTIQDIVDRLKETETKCTSLLIFQGDLVMEFANTKSKITCAVRCAACYRQFNGMEHLVEHMRSSYHSHHEPCCGVCGKHCRSLDDLRDHLGYGASLPPMSACANGCPLCLAVFPTVGALRAHCAACNLSRAPTASLAHCLKRTMMSRMGVRGRGVVALSFKMVGGGSDGTLDMCARVCVVDKQEAILYESFVKPPIPVMHYRYETTGIRPEHLHYAPTVKQVLRRVEDILVNGERFLPPYDAAPLLVGHGLEHGLDALGIDYPAHLRRDTAAYSPLMKTSASFISNSLRYLTQSSLGYDIHTDHQHPYEDCVAAMRLYKKMRAMRHLHGLPNGHESAYGSLAKAFPAWRQGELERMSPEELHRMSKPDYHCWCLDDDDLC